MEQKPLNELGKIIINLAKTNQLFAQIAESSLKGIHSTICNDENFENVPQLDDPKELPPQKVLQLPIQQPVMAPQPALNQTLIGPNIGNQVQRMNPNLRLFFQKPK